jgi:hypothetical protein
LEIVNGEWLCGALEHVTRYGVVYGDQDRSILCRGFYGKSRRGTKWIEYPISLFAKSLQSGRHGALLERRQEA